MLKSGAVLSVICGYEWLFVFRFLAGGIDCSHLSRGGSYSVSRCVRPWIKFTQEYHFKDSALSAKMCIPISLDYYRATKLWNKTRNFTSNLCILFYYVNDAVCMLKQP